MEQNFGKWLKKIRGRARLTQSDMARIVGVDAYTTISAWEKQKAPEMNDQNREALMEVLGYDDEEGMDADWKAGRLPDCAAVRVKVKGASKLPRAIEDSAKRAGMSAEEWLARFDAWLRSMSPHLRTFIEESVREGFVPGFTKVGGSDEQKPTRRRDSKAGTATT